MFRRCKCVVSVFVAPSVFLFSFDLEDGVNSRFTDSLKQPSAFCNSNQNISKCTSSVLLVSLPLYWNGKCCVSKVRHSGKQINFYLVYHCWFLPDSNEISPSVMQFWSLVRMLFPWRYHLRCFIQGYGFHKLPKCNQNYYSYFHENRNFVFWVHLRGAGMFHLTGNPPLTNS
jgi:hypothetical protein